MSALTATKPCQCMNVKNYDNHYHCMECYKSFIPKPRDVDSVLLPPDSPGLKPALARIQELEAKLQLQDLLIARLNEKLSNLQNDKIAQMYQLRSRDISQPAVLEVGVEPHFKVSRGTGVTPIFQALKCASRARVYLAISPHIRRFPGSCPKPGFNLWSSRDRDHQWVQSPKGSNEDL